MISDDLQDQAALYVLGTLDAKESVLFEAALRENAALRAQVREMREALADLAGSVPAQSPPAQLRDRVLREIALEKQAGATPRSTATAFTWLPWAIAALFLVFCGLLAVDRTRLQRALADARAVDPLAQATLVALASPDGENPAAKATVAWQPDRQTGIITITNLPPAGPGRDYQLWVVDANHKDPINGGLIHIEPSGIARVRFKPEQGATQVKAFAISLERTGGVPKREGPIVLIGNS